MLVIRCALYFSGSHIDCYDSILTARDIRSARTANTAAHAALSLVISFTQATQNGNSLSGERPEGLATITRLDALRRQPRVDVKEGGRHRSIDCLRAPDDHLALFVALFGITTLHQVPVIMNTFDLDLLVAHPRTNTLLSSNDSPRHLPSP